MLGKALKGTHPSSSGKGISAVSQHERANFNPLRPTQSSLLNKRASQSMAENSLKRTASQISGGPSPWSSQETIGRRPSDQTIASLNRLESFNSNVAFDENDFEDDSIIDLEEDFSTPSARKQSSTTSEDTLYPILPSSTTETSASSLYPTLPPAIHTTHNAPGSSVPMPWSSSPPTHFQKPPLPAPKAANSSKRKTLPWLDTDNIEQFEYQGSDKERGVSHKNKKSSSDFGKDIIASNKVYKEELEDSRTPKSKYQPESPYMWNKTASAVKEEQKRLRQGHKKLVRDGTNDLDGAAQKRRRNRIVLEQIFLSDEQKQVLELVAQKKKSVFFTGSAGTGKSVLLREAIQILRAKYTREPDRVAVTASTGLAACNVGGVTLHSFAGIGLGKEDVPTLVKKIKRNAKAKQRWMRTKVLIVDEISMVDGDLFDKLEAIARAVRNNGRPFGGIQLVITGDFFQLPPVPDYGKIAKFSFDATTWNTSIEHTIGLTQVFRQKDPVFANMLNEMRLGRLTQKSIDSFRSLSRPLGFNDDFEATELFPTRNEVDRANETRMRNLSGTEFEFKAMDGGSLQDIAQRDKLLSNCMAPPSIKLKRGAQVMLIKNLDEALVNGSVGKVIAFMDEKTFNIYHEDEDEFQAVEAMGLDDEGMTASRKKLKAMISRDLAGSTSHKWPLVRFGVPDGGFRDLLCQQESWKIELPNGEVQASRSQIPLILAWALSIHKAQGQTLERVKVDLGKIFEKGQAYVALSRATCQQGLQITRFDPKKVMAHDRVRAFYDSLYSVDAATNSKALSLTQTTAASPMPAPKYDQRSYEQPWKGTLEEDDALEAMYA